ncbi:MAG: histidine kinase [Bacteroidota bacterium]|nr:histidine kinase [Bacteroidota bacterium]
MKRWKLALWHIAVWCIAPAAVLPAMYRWNATSAIPYWLTVYLIYISSFYVSYYWVLPGWVKRRNTFRLLVNWLGLILIYTAILLFLIYLFRVHQRGSLPFNILKFFIISCTYMCILFLLSLAYRFAMDWFRNDRIRQQLENQNLKTELAFLKSQINPHFLFNTLNSIYVLAYQRSGLAADAVMKLSAIMQYMLYESNHEQVPLAKEINYIYQFMALQRLRTSEQLFFDLSVTGDTESCVVAPLLLVPFIENVFKHGILNNKEDPAIARLEISKEQLIFSCRNRINHSQKDTTGGIGLVNVRRRLELLYPGRHQLSEMNDGNHYSVHLTLQLS